MFHLRLNFNTFLIILYNYGLTLMCVNISPFTFDNPYSTLHNIHSTLMMAAIFSRNM
jgi:hypothetical protein